jgi:AGCS family alanine or glycine:cation symporter
MEGFIQAVEAFSAWLWGIPMMAVLVVTGVFLSFRLRFFQVKYIGYIIKQTLGKIFSKEELGEGTISPFQALTSALASTLGAGNIAGVSVAIYYGGPGAVFWMWVVAMMGMATKFTETVLSLKYRERNEEGEYVGGPMYYMTKGLGWKWLGIWFALAFIVELFCSIMVQSNSIAGNMAESFGVSEYLVGLCAMLFVGVVVIGGIKRIGKVTEKMVPIMALLYTLGVVVIIVLEIDKLPSVIWLILRSAFVPMAPIGGFMGASLAAVLRWGFARGVYSNEAGMGTAPIAHATASTDHPARQGLWSVTEVILDTLACTATAFAVLISGIWTSEIAAVNPSSLAALSFGGYFGTFGSGLVALSLFLFVVTTVLVLVYYAEKQVEFLFGLKAAKLSRYVYIAAIYIGAVGGAKVLWHFLDISLAMIVIPNVLVLLLLSKEVVELKNEFFYTDGRYYLKDKAKG